MECAKIEARGIVTENEKVSSQRKVYAIDVRTMTLCERVICAGKAHEQKKKESREETRKPI